MSSNEFAPAERDDVTSPAAWLVRGAAAALTWFALSRVARFDTPVDQALPWIGCALLAVAWMTRPAFSVAIPLLAVLAVVLPDERTRLLAYGLVVAAVFAAAIVVRERTEPMGALRSASIAILALLLLRWIPLQEVRAFREVVLLVLAAAIVFALRGGPFAIAIGVLVALFTPAVPMRTLALPLVVLAVSATLRFFNAPRVRLRLVPAAAVGAALLFFAWSGLVARALPLVVSGLPLAKPRHDVGIALAPGKSVTLDVPHGATSLVVSGANVPRLREGARLGTMEPGGRSIAIGDASDWGFLRREHHYGTLNPLPRDPAGRVRDYGYTAWIDGAGRLPLPPGARSIRVTADPGLPRDASLQVEGFEAGAP